MHPMIQCLDSLYLASTSTPHKYLKSTNSTPELRSFIWKMGNNICFDWIDPLAAREAHPTWDYFPFLPDLTKYSPTISSIASSIFWEWHGNRLYCSILKKIQKKGLNGIMKLPFVICTKGKYLFLNNI